MEPDFQDPQYWLGFAEGIRLACLVEYRLKQQIATLEEELARSKQENMDQKEELQKLNQKLHLQEPLLNVGVNIRRRFLEKAKMKRGLGNAVESIVAAGNAAAHRGDLKADASLFTLGYLPDNAVEDPPSAGAAYLDLYRELYAFKFIAAGKRDHPSYVGKVLEIHNLTATISSCSSWDPRTAVASMDNLLLQRFSILARDCMRRCCAFSDVMEGEGVFMAIDSCPEVEKNLQEMRRIAEEAVASSMGRRGRYQMGR
jgi:hypothetical protein